MGIVILSGVEVAHQAIGRRRHSAVLLPDLVDVVDVGFGGHRIRVVRRLVSQGIRLDRPAYNVITRSVLIVHRHETHTHTLGLNI